jgi:regulator of protease activity HflC (stomatin/prohibitin superfamily)
MDGVTLAVLAIAAIVVLAAIWFVLVATSIRVEPGTLALLLKRGKATDRALEPGRHFIQPWRKVMVQVYPSRELALIVGGTASGDSRVEVSDPALRLHLGDKVVAQVSCTVRCRLRTDALRMVHERFGPEGIWSALRDTSRRALISASGDAAVSTDDAFGDRYQALEQRLERALAEALDDIGFALTMFSLREIDLAETGEVIQSTLRAGVELEREQALARVRTARLENDAAMIDLLAGVDGDVMLRYRRLEAWGDLVQRWDGDRAIPSALTMPLDATSAALDGDRAAGHPSDAYLAAGDSAPSDDAL